MILLLRRKPTESKQFLPTCQSQMINICFKNEASLELEIVHRFPAVFGGLWQSPEELDEVKRSRQMLVQRNSQKRRQQNPRRTNTHYKNDMG